MWNTRGFFFFFTHTQIHGHLCKNSTWRQKGWMKSKAHSGRAFLFFSLCRICEGPADSWIFLNPSKTCKIPTKSDCTLNNPHSLRPPTNLCKFCSCMWISYYKFVHVFRIVAVVPIYSLPACQIKVNCGSLSTDRKILKRYCTMFKVLLVVPRFLLLYLKFLFHNHVCQHPRDLIKFY